MNKSNSGFATPSPNVDMSSNGGMGTTEDMQVESATETIKPGDGVPERQTTLSNNVTDNGMLYVVLRQDFWKL